MTNELLIRLPAPVRVGDGIGTAVIDRPDLDGLAEAYWRSYADSASSFSQGDARQDMIRYFDGGYGPTLSEASRPVFRDSTVVGAVLTVRDAPYPDVPPGPFVIDLFVVPERRRQGLGMALMAAALTSVATEPVGLRVETDNSAARRLYHVLGFERVPIETRRNMAEPPE